ncbi:hypothetical protein SAMN04490244_104233 [Tranquillimonas rosea]|uniref:Nickel/cobalt transporter regulator n=1 Tax=Tranquillimonas rosea TaxID=641238 RepID=A0A1H9TKM3_9RHOB|nr:hypothetical protein [Tranquillimonas rosea]SER97544.1 hypothetical protein SAMN04490244_104233 [Tranquillimonas rosea]
MFRTALLTLLLPASALACPDGAKCITPGDGGLNRGSAGKWVTAPVSSPPVEVGHKLEPGQYPMVFNTRYYGLPPVRDGWVYYEIENEIYRVDRDTLEVLEQATDEANRAF